MIINLNYNIVDLDGNELPDSNMAKILAQLIITETNSENAIKMYYWAQKLHKNEELDMDKTDYDMFHKFVESSTRIPVITKAQILEKIKQ